MDNNNSNNQNPPRSPVQSPPSTVPPTAAIAASPVEVSAQSGATVAPSVHPSASIPSVVVQAKEKSLPFWFYILFGLVAVIFFFVTFLLAKTLLDKQKENTVQNIVPVLTQAATPNVSPAISVSPAPADNYITSMENVSDSDEIADIESDLDKTATLELKTDITNLDTSVSL